MPAYPTTTVRLMHHDPLISSGVRAVLREHTDLELGEEAGFPADGRPADVVVADYEHGMALIAAARSLPAGRAAAVPKVLVLTARASELEIRWALEQGARGYLLLGCGLEELVEGIRTVHQGARYVCAPAARRLADSVASAALTGREADVLRLVAEGLCNKVVARELGIAIGTVKSHLKAVFEKLGAKSRTEVAAVAERRGLLTLPASSPPPRMRETRRFEASAGAVH